MRGGGRLREVGSAQGRLDARETVGDAPSPSLRYFGRLAQRGVRHWTRVPAPRRAPHREEHHVSVNLGMGLFEHAEALDHLRDGHGVVAVSREGVVAPVRGARVCHGGRRTRGLGDGPGGARRPSQRRGANPRSMHSRRNGLVRARGAAGGGRSSPPATDRRDTY